MEWKWTQESLATVATDTVVVFHGHDQESTHGTTRTVDQAINFRISLLTSCGEITGQLGEVRWLHNWGLIPAERVMIAGLGAEQTLSIERFKEAVAYASRQMQQIGVTQFGIGCPEMILRKYNAVDVVQAIVEGVEIGSFEHSFHQQLNEHSFEQVVLSLPGISQAAFDVGVERGRIFAHATNLSRTLESGYPDEKSLQRLIDCAESIANQQGLDMELLTEPELQQINMKGLLSVVVPGTGKMIILTYHGLPHAKNWIGLIGSGFVRKDGTLNRRTGLAGAAVLLASLDAIANFTPHVNIMVVIPIGQSSENKSHRMGEVVETRAGKTIEVANTSADERVMMADAVTYAKHHGAKRLLTLTALTEPDRHALGGRMTGMLTRDVEWGTEIERAARIAGEPMWRLPLCDSYNDLIESEIADLKLGRTGTIQGGLFLHRFADCTPFIHLDLGGTVVSERESGIFRKGATGAMTRTLIQLLIDK